MAGRMGMSISGSGHLLCYSLGVARTLISHGDLRFGDHFCGASGGAVVATAVACLREAAVLDEFLSYAVRCRSLSGLRDLLPDDAHTRARGRLYIGVTECETGAAMQLSEFPSRDELLACVFASCRIPRCA